jgi:hypothetical protein
MADDQGFGQQHPTDAAGEFNSQRFIIDQALARISTARLVQVKGVDTAAKTVDVQPLVKQMDGEGNATDHGTIFGIPYMALQFGKSGVIADPVVGDKGLMVVCDRDISAVKANKTFAQPGSLRQFDMADGLYFGGVMNDDPEQWVKFTDTGLELKDKSNNKLVSSSNGWEFTGPVKFNQVVTMSGNLQLGGDVKSANGGTYAGNFQTSGEVTAGNIGLKTHKHGGVQTGSGQSGGPVP